MVYVGIYRKFRKIWTWFMRHVSGQTKGSADIHKDRNTLRLSRWRSSDFAASWHVER